MEPLRDDDPAAVGPYALTARLGGGGMGQVFLGRSPGGRPVAVKLIRAEYAADGGFRRRFAAEVAAARRVGGFYTAQVVDADPHADRPWLVTAYVPGPSLQDAVADHGPLPVRTVRTLGAGLAEGLAAVHACGLVHRDLKPGNVILAADGPRVIDFGIVRALEDTSGTATGAIVGTVAYMAPEQARGDREIRPPADVFALGSVLAFAATGEPPFGRTPPAAVMYRILHADPDLTGVPGDLRDLVAACLAKDPGDRPAVADVLAACAAGADAGERWLPDPVHAQIARLDDAVPPHPPPLPPTVPDDAAPAPGRRTARRAAIVLGAVAAVAVLVAGGAVAAGLLADGSGGRGPGAAASSPSGPSASPDTGAGGAPSGPTPSGTPPASPGTTSEAVGRVHDDRAGFSYARLGAPWIDAGGAWTGPGMFTAGQIAPIGPERNGVGFNATSVSGVPRPVEIGDYAGPDDLGTVAARVKTRIVREMFNIPHTEASPHSGPAELPGGVRGWLEQVRLDFPQAAANGWPVRSTTLAILLVDTGGADGGPPGLLLVSVPDALPTQGDLEQVLGSVQVP
ncbi:serine/threonine-protein kinase [Spirillospora sp. NPDC052242]